MDASSPVGLLRLPHFFKTFFHSIRQEQIGRDGTDEPSLFNTDMQLSDLWVALASAAVLLFCRLFLNYILFPRVFRRYPKQLVPKISENLFYSVYYLLSFLYFALAVLPSSDWHCNLFSNESSVVRQLIYPFPPPMNFSEHMYYSQTTGFYISATIFLLVWDGRRSDFGQMVLHHFVTVGLVVVSYLYGYVRAGIIIVALHDFGDIFLYSAKLVHHLGYKGFDTAIFAVFAVAFYVTRLVMFSRLVHGITVETLQVIVAVPPFNKWAYFYDTYLPHYVFFFLFLNTLQLLHCYWYALVLRLIYKEVVLGLKISEHGDPRSDDEGEDEKVTDFKEEEDAAEGDSGRKTVSAKKDT